MIIDVALLLDFADYSTAALSAGDQPGEGEVVRASSDARASLRLARDEHPQYRRKSLRSSEFCHSFPHD
jgi:hypothetical protein